MLAKVTYTELLRSETYSNKSLTTNFVDQFTITTNYKKIKYTFIDTYITATSDNAFVVRIYKSDNTYVDKYNTKILWVNNKATFSQEIEQTWTGNTFKFAYAAQSSTKLYWDLQITWKLINTNVIKWLPRDIKYIGNKSTITIFGKHIDNSRVTQDVE